jgi:hypothetical protein
MGTTEEAGRHFIVSRPKTGGRGQKAAIGVGSSQNCCRTKGKVGEVQSTAKSGRLILSEQVEWFEKY